MIRRFRHNLIDSLGSFRRPAHYADGPYWGGGGGAFAAPARMLRPTLAASTGTDFVPLPSSSEIVAAIAFTASFVEALLSGWKDELPQAAIAGKSRTGAAERG